MLPLTRLTGQSFALNPDLIERAEATPDTVVTLVNGSKYVIRESLDELIRSVRDYRSELVSASHATAPGTGHPSARVAARHAARADADPAAQAGHPSSLGTVVPIRAEQGEF